MRSNGGMKDNPAGWAWLTAHHKRLSRVIQGERILLFKNGTFLTSGTAKFWSLKRRRDFQHLHLVGIIGRR